MTVEEAKKKYGTFDDDSFPEGYVFCNDCPLEASRHCACTKEEYDYQCHGEEEAWESIAEYMTLKEEEIEASKTVETVEPSLPPKEDVVNHPSHYTNGGMECIDEMILIFGKQAVMNFCLCNVWKYRKRALHKNGQEDLDKADWYMKKYKELKEEMDSKPLQAILKEGITYGA